MLFVTLHIFFILVATVAICELGDDLGMRHRILQIASVGFGIVGAASVSIHTVCGGCRVEGRKLLSGYS